MILILPQIKFEASPSEDVGGVAFQAETDASHQNLGFCCNNFSLVVLLALILKFWFPSEETFPKMYTFAPL